jgi:ribosomal protein S12 methylthiotransferase accessory factor
MDGAAADPEQAAEKAIAEALRFYCAAFYAPEELVLTSSSEAPFPCAPPAAFALYSPEQYRQPDFPFVPLTERTRIRWVPATDLATGSPCHVPAAMALLPYTTRPESGEARVIPHSSTGLACASSVDEAATLALCSAIQDDAVAIVWQARLAMPQIRVETLSDYAYELVSRFERSVGSITLLDLSGVSGIPVVLAALRGSSPGSPALVFARGAAPEPEGAVRTALEELAVVLRYSQQIQAHIPPLPPIEGHLNVRDQVGHLRFWCDPGNTPLADFLFSSKQRLEFDALPGLPPGPPAELRHRLVEQLRAAGLQVLQANLTTPDLRALGLSVVRAVVPGLHPLLIGHGQRALGGARLREVPRQLALRKIESAGENAAPHPFLNKGVV